MIAYEFNSNISNSVNKSKNLKLFCVFFPPQMIHFQSEMWAAYLTLGEMSKWRCSISVTAAWVTTRNIMSAIKSPSPSAKTNAAPICFRNQAICQTQSVKDQFNEKLPCVNGGLFFLLYAFFFLLLLTSFFWFPGNVQSQQVWGVSWPEACAAGLQCCTGEHLICLLVFRISNLTAKYVSRRCWGVGCRPAMKHRQWGVGGRRK